MVRVYAWGYDAASAIHNAEFGQGFTSVEDAMKSPYRNDEGNRLWIVTFEAQEITF